MMNRRAMRAWFVGFYWVVGFSLVGFKAEAQTSAGSSLNKGAVPDQGNDSAKMAAQLTALRDENARLRTSLDLANAEVDSFRRQWLDLRLRDQALGVNALSEDARRLEARLVEAVRELYRTEEERRGAVNRLQQLLDGGQKLLKKSQGIDPQARADYEAAARAARELLQAPEKAVLPVASSLEDGRIVDVNRALGAVIVNLGSALGAKPGMPLRVLRDEREIGRLKVFEVRETVCAALVEVEEKEKELNVGDRVAIAAQK